MWTHCYVSVLLSQGTADRHSPYRVTEQSVMGSGSRNHYVRCGYKLMKQVKNLTPTYSTHLLLSEQDSEGIWQSRPTFLVNQTITESENLFRKGLDIPKPKDICFAVIPNRELSSITRSVKPKPGIRFRMAALNFN